MMNIAANLEKSSLFAGLEPETIRFIAKRFETIGYKAGEFVFNEGDKGRGFYIIASGIVSILKGRGISRRELRRLDAGHGFGEMALISDEPRTASAKAITDTQLLRLDQGAFNGLLELNVRFAQRMLRMIARRLRRADDTSTQDLMRAHEGLIISLSELADSRDAVTGAHLYRVRDYCTLLARLMAETSRFKGQITHSFIEAIYHVSPLHDIGKVAVPDRILQKKGKLTEEEFEVIRAHTIIGARSIDTVLEYCNLEMFHIARGLIAGHHEHYDGNGYPLGLSGDDIPLEARIMSVSDYYDALLSERPYKAAYGHDRVIEAIRKESGKKFDPAIVQIMLENIDQFEKIYREYLNNETHKPLKLRG